MKASKSIKLALLGSTIALSGCSSYEDRRLRDGVPVVMTPAAGYHWSPYYNGYVPLIVPMYGFSSGVTYHHVYTTSYSSGGRSYPPPVSRPRPATSTTSTTKPSGSVSTPASASVSKSTTTSSTRPASAATSRGGFGGFGASSGSSSS